MSIVVRSARSDEVEESRRLRLEMLADSPDSFNERLDALERWPTSRWASRLTSSLAPDSTLLVAEVGGVWIGQAAGRLYAHYDPVRAYVLAVYVTPAHRSRGIAAALVRGIADWATRQGTDRLWLDVHEDAGPARALYRRLGFVATGVTVPYMHDRSRSQVELALSLAGHDR